MDEASPDPVAQPDNSLTGPLSFAGLTAFMGPVGGHVADPDELAAGTVIGGVRIVRFIGSGGMGRVYEGVQLSPQRTVAVKVLHPGRLNALAARRLAHEAQILGRLSHPGIARIHAAGVQRMAGQDAPYFVMEYVERPRSITAYAAVHRLSTRERVMLFREVCAAVAHGHERGIVHRDLKPGNILVDAGRQPKVIDFGVARCSTGDSPLTTMHTATGELLGTAQYMAPEQLFGAADGVDARADVYALGLVLYELLTGALPYDVQNRPIYEVARVVRDVEPRSLASVDRSLRGDLTAIVGTCLDKERGRRYPTAAALAADLDRHLNGEPITARPPGLIESLARLAARHRAAALGVAAVLVTLVSAAVGMSLLAIRAERQRALATTAAAMARQQLYRANTRSLQSFLEVGNQRAAQAVYADNLALAGADRPLELLCLGGELDEALAVLLPTGDPVAEVSYDDGGARLDVTSPLPTSLPPRLAHLGETPMPRGARHYRLLQRRRRLRFTVGAGDDYRPAGPAATSEEELAADATFPDEPAGETIAGDRQLEVTPDGRVVIRSVSGDRVLLVLGEPRGRLTRFAFAPGGSRVVVLTTAGTLEIWDAKTGALVTATGSGERCADFVFSPDGSRLAWLGDRPAGRLEVSVCELGDGSLVSSFTVRGSRANGDVAIAFRGDGRALLASGPGGDVDLWDVDAGRLERSFSGHDTAVTALGWSRDGRLVASGDRGGRICLWNLASGILQRRLVGHTAEVLAVGFNPDANRLASGGTDGTVRIWATGLDRPLNTVPLAGEPSAVAFRPDGRELAVASAAGTLELWDALAVKRRLTLPVAGAEVNSLGYSPDGRLLAVALSGTSSEGEVRVFDREEGVEVARLGGHTRGARQAVFSADGGHLCTTAGDQTVAVWSLAGGKRLWQTRAAQHASHANLGGLFALGGALVAYKQPALLDAATGEVKHSLVQGQVWCQAVSADGSRLARGTGSGRTYLVDCRTGETCGLLKGHLALVRAVAFSADGRRLVTGSDGALVKVWELPSGRELHTFKGHEAAVTAATFTPDGARIVTASQDGTARIWDADLGVELCQFPTSAERPDATVLGPDGRVLVTVESDAAGLFLKLRGLSNAAITSARHGGPTRAAGSRPTSPAGAAALPRSPSRTPRPVTPS